MCMYISRIQMLHFLGFKFPRMAVVSTELCVMLGYVSTSL